MACGWCRAASTPPDGDRHRDPGRSGAASYVFDIDWHLPDVDLPEAPLAVHTGSIGAFLEPGAATVERILLAAHRKATVSFDPNARPALMGDPVTARAPSRRWWQPATSSRSATRTWPGWRPARSPSTSSGSGCGSGPSVVVVTRGGEGATALARSGRVDQPTPRVQVVDTVGAGDAFSSGLLDALWTENLLGGDRRAALREIGVDALQRVLAHAATVAAITVTRAGAEPPTRADLQAWSAPAG